MPEHKLMPNPEDALNELADKLCFLSEVLSQASAANHFYLSDKAIEGLASFCSDMAAACHAASV